MKQSFVLLAAICFLGFSFPLLALENSQSLENKLFEKNQEYLSLQKQAAANEALLHSSYSGFYPTLNLVGGYGKNRTDDLPTAEKGAIGYAEGRFNLFRGFKDQVLGLRKKNQFEISKIEKEFKKNQLKYELTEAISTMIYLHQLGNILTEELKTTQLQKQMAGKKVSAGLTGSVDNLEFELKEDEITIEQNQLRQKHFEAHQNIIRLFGEDIADSELAQIGFSPAENLLKVTTPVHPESTLQSQKSQLFQYESELDRKDFKSDFLPSLDFTYGFGRITPSDDNPTQFNESRYALLLTVPLFSGFESYYKLKAASLNNSAAEQLKNQRQIEVGTSLKILVNSSAELKELYEINEKRLTRSGRYFDLTLSEYRRGIKNSPDLVAATDRLFSAKKKKIEVLKELELLHAKLSNYY